MVDQEGRALEDQLVDESYRETKGTFKGKFDEKKRTGVESAHPLGLLIETSCGCKRGARTGLERREQVGQGLALDADVEREYVVADGDCERYDVQVACMEHCRENRAELARVDNDGSGPRRTRLCGEKKVGRIKFRGVWLWRRGL